MKPRNSLHHGKGIDVVLSLYTPKERHFDDNIATRHSQSI
jgi:hypothetical protein